MEATPESMVRGEHDSLSAPVDLSVTRDTAYKLADFLVVVHPFHRLVYWVGFAYTYDSAAAELLSVRTIAAAFKAWRQQPKHDELKLWLIRIALSEARAYFGRNASPVGRTCREEIADLVVAQGTAEWRPVPRHAMRDRDVRDALIGAMQELSPATRVILLLRDVFRLTNAQVAAVVGESRQSVQGRLAFGRIALCIKLAKRDSGRDLLGQASVATAH
jgi:DNA-directed RNA polymerase specialized sigma24 family protein